MIPARPHGSLVCATCLKAASSAPAIPSASTPSSSMPQLTDMPGRIATTAQYVIARYNDLRAKRGDTPLTMNAIPKFFSGQYTTDNVLRKGLRLASVPERLQGSE